MRPVLLVLAALLAASAASAQIGFSATNGRNHPELRWLTARTAHFEIVYPDRLAGIELEAAAIAEASLAALVVNLSPADSARVRFTRPIRLYLSDEDEIVNGTAYSVGSSGFTTIWAPVNAAAEVFTGRDKWLRKVIAHELAHLVHFRATRSNIGLLSTFFADPMPPFWAEGIAQYQTERWDAQRGERWLRTAVFEGRLSSSDGQSVQNGRLLYASGNAQVRWLAESLGDSTIAEILAHRRRELFGLARVHDFGSAFRAVVGQPYGAWAEEWRKHMGVYVNTMAAQMERQDSLGRLPLALPGQVIYDVAYSPDTSRVAVVALPSLERPVRRLYVTETPPVPRRVGRAPRPARRDAARRDSARAPARTPRRTLRILAEGLITGPVAWRPDGAEIAFARTRRGRHGSLVNDLYTVDVATRRTRRLTTDRRAVSPTYAPDGRRIAFVGVDGPTANVFVLDAGTETRLTRFTGNTEITSVRWSPDGRRLVAAVFTDAGRRELVVVDAATGATRSLGTDPSGDEALRDDRGPVWAADSRHVAYTSLRDRVPNVFLLDVDAPPAPSADRLAPNPLAADTLAADTLASLDARENVPSPLPAGAGQAGGEGQGEGPAQLNACRSAEGAPSPCPGSGGRGDDAERASLPPETRVTFLATGASVHAWLPPDARHPHGRLVLSASETKRRDRLFWVPADRRPTVAAPETAPTPQALGVPDAYARWTTHAPPNVVPTDVPPDPALITARGRYRSARNLTHAITLPLPYADPAANDYGAFVNSLWVEPLGKHTLALLAGVSVSRPVDRSFLLLTYINRQFAPTLTLDLYRFPSPSSFYGNSVLVEDLTGGDLSATWPLDVFDRPFRQVLGGLRLRYAYASPLDPDRFTDLDAAGTPLGVPEAGTRFDVQAGLATKFQRPYRYNVVAPLDGAGVRARATVGIPGLGASRSFLRPDVLGFATLPTPFGGTRLFVQGRATAVVGQQLAQDFVGLSRFDDVDFQLPLVGTVTLDDAERVRGYRQFAVGTRVLFGSAEVRSPVLFDLNTSLLGLVRLGGVAASAFADGGLVWTGADVRGGVQRLGVGVEASNVVSFGGVFEFRHALGVGVPASRLGEVVDGTIPSAGLDVYYRVQGAIPF